MITAASVPPVTRSSRIDPQDATAIRALLNIPRPRTRADCLDGPRPCPWVACRHHLLFEVARPPAASGARRAASEGAALVLNAPLSGASRRRPHLHASAAAEVVRVWIDDALERWQSLGYTCSLDRADDVLRLRAGKTSLQELAELRGLSRAQMRREMALAGAALRVGLAELRRAELAQAEMEAVALAAVRGQPTDEPPQGLIVRIERDAPPPRVLAAGDIFTW